MTISLIYTLLRLIITPLATMKSSSGTLIYMNNSIILIILKITRHLSTDSTTRTMLHQCLLKSMQS